MVDHFGQEQKKDGNVEPLDACEKDTKEEEPDKEEEPYATKSGLYKYFAGKAPSDMISSFLHDERNHGHAVILCDLTQPLEHEYALNQEVISSGPEEALLWAGKRAQGSWFNMVLAIASILQSLQFARNLRLTFASSSPVVEIPPWLQAELKLLRDAWDFGCHLISAILWANLLHTYRLPHAAAVYLLPGSAERDMALERVKDMVRCLLKATWQKCQQKPNTYVFFILVIDVPNLKKYKIASNMTRYHIVES